MKINFKNILCRPSLKSEELISIDIAADLADAIYQGTTSFEDYQLAVAIFNSDGEFIMLFINDSKPSNKKLIHKFKGENEFLIFFNSEQCGKMFAEFLNKFIKKY